MRSRLAAQFPWTSSLVRLLWPARPARRKRWVLVAGVVLLLLLVHTVWVAVASRRLVGLTERLAERWGPMAPASMSPEPVPDMENAAKAVAAAAEMLAMPERPMGDTTTVMPREFGSYASREPDSMELAGLRQGVADNALALRILDEAVGRTRSNWNLRYRYGIHAELPNLLHILNLSQLNVTAGRLSLRDGDAEGVVRALARGEAIERSLVDEPVLIIQMIRLGAQRHMVALLREWLMTGPVSEPQLRAAMEIYGRQSRGYSLEPALVGEGKSMLDAVLNAGGRSLTPWMDQRAEGFLVSALTVLIEPVILDNLRAYLLWMDHSAQCAAQLRYLRPASCAGTDPESAGPYHFLVRIMTPGFGPMLARADMAEARQRMVSIVLELERRRMESGSYPGSLDALALSEDLIDPLTGNTFGYERTAAGFHLFSEGENPLMQAGEMPRLYGAPYDPVLDWEVQRGASAGG